MRTTAPAPAMLLRTVLLLAVSTTTLVTAQSDAWTHDGGDSFRMSAVELAFDVTAVGGRTRTSFAYLEPPEDSVSEVEGSLLTSPLVTSMGTAPNPNNVVVYLDTCSLVMLRDPSTFAPSGSTFRSWLPLATWSPADDPSVPAGYQPVNECEPAGIVLDKNDVVYMLDRNNHILHAVQASASTLTYLWSAAVNKTAGGEGEHAEFDDDVSMVSLPNGRLWVPLMGTFIGSAGIAWVLDTLSYGATTYFVPTPSPYCDQDTGPADYGSAQVALRGNGLGVVQLSSTYCGRLSYSMLTNPLYPQYLSELLAASYPPLGGAPVFEFETGEHSHPLFDESTFSLFYFNYQYSPFSPPQQLCCLDTSSPTAGEACSRGAWPSTPGGCLSLPTLSTGPSTDPLGPPLNYRWSWLAGGLDVVGGYLYVAASGAVDEKAVVGDPGTGVKSALWVFSTNDGTLLASHTFFGDLINSAPLVVLSTTGGAVAVVVTTATGKILSYKSGPAGVSAGWAWSTSGEIGGVPPSELPSSTYSYLSATPLGTLLVTTTPGGDAWATEKAYYAVVNGLVGPGGGGGGGKGGKGLSGGEAFGVALAVLAGLGLVGYALWVKVPAARALMERVGGAVGGGLGRVAALVSNDMGGGSAAGGFKPLGMAKEPSVVVVGGMGGGGGILYQASGSGSGGYGAIGSSTS